MLVEELKQVLFYSAFILSFVCISILLLMLFLVLVLVYKSGMKIKFFIIEIRANIKTRLSLKRKGKTFSS